jgi:protein SCO1/2
VKNDPHRPRRFFSIAFILAGVFFLPSCQHSKPPVAKRYPFTGRVISVDAQAQSALIDGDNIPGFMDAMAMPYRIKPPAMLSKLSPGDSITADLIDIQSMSNNAASDSWLENVKITGHSTPPPTAALHLPAPGEAVPDFSFTNQNGKHISFKQYSGKVLLVTFIYTRCPFPDFCPRMSSNFAEAYKHLAMNPAIHLLSLSFDPEHDTPKVLRDYGFSVAHTHDPALFTHWEFAAPSAADLPKIADFFALTVKPEGGLITHTLSTAVIAPDGKIIKWYHGSDWQVSDLIKDAMAPVLKKSESNGKD